MQALRNFSLLRPARCALASLPPLAPLAARGARAGGAPPPPLLVRRLCAPAAPAAPAEAAAPASTEAAAVAVAEPHWKKYVGALRPSMTGRNRWERLQAAFDRCREGGEFVLEDEEPAQPGPCGAVMNTLRETGPMSTGPLLTAVEERYPGVITSKRRFKQLLKTSLSNHVMKIRSGERQLRGKGGHEGRMVAGFKDTWAIRRPGQVRQWAARRGRVGRGKSYGHHA